MFDRILIANRGEIACRIIRTCRRLDVATVAVYSSADRRAMHVQQAGAAIRIGAAPSSESYLNIEAVIRAAQETGAQAIHPGYGFLSENAGFAAACAAAGIVFIGPPVSAIRAMGSKSEAKKIMAAAGVPVMAGDPDAAQDDSSLSKAADAIGYPVIVKPSMGGGGRGMRVVRDAAGLPEALAAARREAASSFGDSALLVEKYLDGARHIEVQVFADSRGNVVHLYERDCSVQRRHQKVIEEAPAPGIDAAVRARMADAAVTAARTVGYVGAGTVEFLLGADGDFRFMEMNTRLQVEHPVTEAVTGIDLVEWQLRVAAGEPLPLGQDDIPLNGHAVEARLYAEDPAAGFLPGFGRLARLSFPDGPGLRVDAGVREGDEVTVHYDPMIAKLIAHGPDRGTACTRLSAALGGVRIAGPATNEAFLKAIVDHPDFRAGGVDTGFLAAQLDSLVSATEPPDEIVLLAAMAELTRPGPASAVSPWADGRGWRLGGSGGRSIVLRSGDRRFAFRLEPGGGAYRDGTPVDAAISRQGGDEVAFTLNGATTNASTIRHGTALFIFAADCKYRLKIDDPLAARAGAGTDAGSLFARMPGVVVALSVAPGDLVEAGATLIVVEAMKVEHSIRAPSAGTVSATPFAVGDRVSEGDELIGFDPA